MEVTFQVTRPYFSSTKGALCALKAIKECDESHVDFMQHCGESLVATSALFRRVYRTWKYQRLSIEVTFQVTRTDFLNTKGALCAVKATKECDESLVNLTQHCGESLVATSAVLRRVYRI